MTVDKTRRKLVAAIGLVSISTIAGCAQNLSPDENAIARGDHQVGWYDAGRINDTYESGSVTLQNGAEYQVRVVDASYQNNTYSMTFSTDRPQINPDIETRSVARTLYIGVNDPDFKDERQPISQFEILIQRAERDNIKFSVSGQWIKEYFNTITSYRSAPEQKRIDAERLVDQVVSSYSTI